MNETHHETTEFTPIEIHLNQKPKKASESWLKIPPLTPNITYERKIERTYEKIIRKGKKRAEAFNRNHKLTKLKVGDLVLIKLFNKSEKENKILAKFLQIYDEPFEIRKEIQPGTYILCDPGREEEKGMYHTQDLKRYITRK